MDPETGLQPASIRFAGERLVNFGITRVKTNRHPRCNGPSGQWTSGLCLYTGTSTTWYKLGAEGRNRTDNLSERVLSAPRLPVSPQPQSWCVSPDSNRDPMKEAGLSRSRLPIPARGANLGEPARFRTVISSLGNCGLVLLDDRLEYYGRPPGSLTPI